MTEKRIPVRNKETGKTVYKTPDLVSRKPDLYEKLPQEYDRNPKGRPHAPKQPGNDRLPGPPRLVKIKKPQDPQPPKKPIPPVPLVKVVEAPKPPLRDNTSRSAMLLAISRVARYVQGGELSKSMLDKWKSKLSAASKQPLPSSVRDWGYHAQEVLYTLDVIEREFDEAIPNTRARESFKDRLADIRKDYAYSIQHVQNLARVLNQPLDETDPKSHLYWYLANAIEVKFSKATPTVGHLLTTHWTVDTNALSRLLSKLLKVATAEDLKALGSESYWHQRQAFLARTNALALAQKCVKKSKDGTETPLEWLDWTLKVLRANYTQEGQQDNLQQFDLYGMKIVVDDSTVDNIELELYVKYLQEAYARLKSKGFASVWYGTIFIQCKDCGGVNRNTGGGTGAWYQIGKDTVTLFHRPAKFIVELMIHELGHRFWFKSMSQEQRLRFKSLIKTHTIPRPTVDRTRENLGKDPIPTKAIDTALSGVDRDLESVLLTLGDLDRVSREDLTDFTDWTKVYLSDLKKDHGMDTLPGNNDYLGLAQDIREKASNFERTPEWATSAEQLVRQYAEALKRKITECVTDHNRKYDPMKDYEDSYTNNPASVVPVSDYGKSNPDEAFAEAFAHFILGYDMTSDQAESFKSVLKKVASTKKYDHIDFKPPASVANAAKKGLEYRRKANPSDKGGLTPAEASKEGVGSGVQRAVNLKNRDNASPEVIRQMNAFFSRHEKNKSIAPEFKDEPWRDKGYVSWLIWGGDPGQAWAAKVLKQMEEADNAE